MKLPWFEPMTVDGKAYPPFFERVPEVWPKAVTPFCDKNGRALPGFVWFHIEGEVPISVQLSEKSPVVEDACRAAVDRWARVVRGYGPAGGVFEELGRVVLTPNDDGFACEAAHRLQDAIERAEKSGECFRCSDDMIGRCGEEPSKD